MCRIRKTGKFTIYRTACVPAEVNFMDQSALKVAWNSNFESNLQNTRNFARQCRVTVFYTLSVKALPEKPWSAALPKYDQQKNALAITSSGIAATLLNGGQMHIQYSSIHEKSDAMCNIKKRAELLRYCKGVQS
ncbi:hypothetical protein TNCV_1198501 [Trichonephila clavipes]|uniref:Uncharacterized protein n=1 Tax=Trichonephila clavipes TaxID=2585209 RepID=A0A8X6V453_TRICX|nr:hypothetical protein TNCV_1198501 [Trichonephila clavipes]